MEEKELYTNKLINEKSPYLLQHAHNPVNWYPWGNEAFEKARKEDKPIFLYKLLEIEKCGACEQSKYAKKRQGY